MSPEPHDLPQWPSSGPTPSQTGIQAKTFPAEGMVLGTNPPTVAPITHDSVEPIDEKNGLHQRILQVARGQYEQYGFARVSMDDIASALGISKKTLYHHYDNKEALIRAVLECNLAEIDAGVKAIHHDAGCGILEKLRRLVSFITNVYSKLSPNLLHDLRKSQPQVWHQVQEHRQCHMDTDFVELIRNGQKQGLFRSDIDERLFLRIYMAAVQDVLQPGVLSEMPFPPQEVYATLSRIFFEGFLTDKARDEYHAQI